MKVLVYLQALSRFAMAKDKSGAFRNVSIKVGAKHFSGLLYKGRPLEPEEFNAEMEEIFYPKVNRRSPGIRVLVEMVDDDDLPDFDFDEVEQPEQPDSVDEPDSGQESGEVQVGTTGEPEESGESASDMSESDFRALLEEKTKGEIAEILFTQHSITISTNQNKSAVIDDAVAALFSKEDDK